MVCSGLKKIRRTGTGFRMGCGIYGRLVLCLIWTLDCMADWYWICSGLSIWMTITVSVVSCRVYGGAGTGSIVDS